MDMESRSVNRDIHILGNIVPLNVWKLVSQKLLDQNDLENCSNSSMVFYELFLTLTRCKVVLPKAFELLAKRLYYVNSNDTSSTHTIPWNSAADQQITHTLAGIWNCRLLCKSFNHAFEMIHRDKKVGHFKMLLDSKAPENVFLARWAIEKFTDISTVDRFIEKFVNTHFDFGRRIAQKSPFLGNSVEIHFDAYREQTNHGYMFGLMQMLKKFGGFVSIFHFNFDYGGSGGQDYLYQKIIRFLLYMPNIQVLRVTYFYEGDSSIAELHTLKNDTIITAFPNLQRLKFASLCHVAGPIVNEIVRQNQQISQLEIERCNFFGNCSIFTNKLQNLRQLSLKIDSLENFEKLQTSDCHYRLKRLDLIFTESCEFIRWSMVFAVLADKITSDSHIDIILEMPHPRSTEEMQLVIEESLSCRLVMPGIQNISIRQICYFYIDFLLLSSDSIRKLELEYNMFDFYSLEHYFDRQIIQIWGNEKNLMDSNIKAKLPYLKEIKFTYKSETQVLLF